MKYNTLEKQLKFNVADFMKLQYPEIPFRIDFDQFILPAHIRMQVCRLRNGEGWPDVQVMYPTKHFHGLFGELKSSRDKIYKRDGMLRQDEHLVSQLSQMQRLESFGYLCCFSWSVDHFAGVMKSYLTGGL